MHKMVMDPVSFAFWSEDAQLAAGEPPLVFRCIPTPVPPWTWAVYQAKKADDVLSQSCPENKCLN